VRRLKRRICIGSHRCLRAPRGSESIREKQEDERAVLQDLEPQPSTKMALAVLAGRFRREDDVLFEAERAGYRCPRLAERHERRNGQCLQLGKEFSAPWFARAPRRVMTRTLRRPETLPRIGGRLRRPPRYRLPWLLIVLLFCCCRGRRGHLSCGREPNCLGIPYKFLPVLEVE